jgi:putative hemolysin
MEIRNRRIRLSRVGPLIGVVLLAPLLPGCGDDDEPADTTVALANPASVFCEEQGGQVEIVEEAEGQRGECVFPDGTRVDEWEYYRANATPSTTSP